MFIAHVHFAVAPDDLQAALDTLLAEAPSVRAMSRCRTFPPFLDGADPCRLGVLHEWETQEDFAAYAASPGFAATGRVLRPMMTDAPVSRRFQADLLPIVV
jgi:quinol monooxygenase YgiN